MKKKQYDLFISYSHDDNKEMEEVTDLLRMAGFDVWMDKALRAGQQWQKQLKKVLIKVSGVLLLSSPSAVDSDWVERECNFASEKGIPIFTLCIKGENLQECIPFQVSTDQVVDARSDLTAGANRIMVSIFDRIRRQVMYRPMKAITNIVPPENPQTRAVIYTIDNETNNHMKMHTVYGLFMQHFLPITYQILQGTIGKVWADKQPAVFDLYQVSREERRSSLYLNDDQLDALDNIYTVLTFPLFDLDNTGNSNRDTIVGVAQVDSPFTLEQLNLETQTSRERVITAGLRQTARIERLLAIEARIT